VYYHPVDGVGVASDTDVVGMGKCLILTDSKITLKYLEKIYFWINQLKNGSRYFHLLVCYGALTLLVIVALRQQYYVHRHQLTPWLGGGMGMFATVDRLQYRLFNVYFILEDGEEIRLEHPYRPYELSQLQLRARIMPTDANLRDAAELIAQTSWGLLEAEDGMIIAQHRGIDAEFDPIDFVAIRVEVLRVMIDTQSSTLSMTELNSMTYDMSDSKQSKDN